MLETISTLDFALMDWLTPWQPPWLDSAMMWISASGGAGTVWVLLALVSLLTPRTRAAAWRVLLTVALAYILVDGVIKPTIARARPTYAAAQARALEVDALDPKRAVPPLPTTYSFPSGHATSTFGAAVAVSRMWPAGRVLWWTLAVLIGYSRIYLGHHFPLDVAGGALLGIALAFWVLGGRNRATYPARQPSESSEAVATIA